MLDISRLAQAQPYSPHPALSTLYVHWPQLSEARNPASVGQMETDAGAAVVSEKMTSSPESSSRLRRAHSHWPETLAAS